MPDVGFTGARRRSPAADATGPRVQVRVERLKRPV